ncbi:MAG: phenylalanine--tRNA ligase subunit beta [Christensenellales bacterium]
MKTSMNWLRCYTPISLDDQAYMEAMIRTGTAVERVERLGDSLDQVVVGRVVSCLPHENSDHLHVCQVDVGAGDLLQIVCGAPNVAEGQLVPVALVGAKLPGGLEIKPGKLRGVASNGMLCSASELLVPQDLYPSVGEAGLLVFGEDHPLGSPVRLALGLDDAVVDVEVLANRPDLLSVWGLARESAAVLDLPFTLPRLDYREGPGDIRDYVAIRIEDEERCPRYAGRVIRNVRVAPSPLWLRSFLHAAGMRSINNIVDITNYVMLETGHPMHAFDLQQVRGGQIIVRTAGLGESLTTLDGRQHALVGGELLICDGQGPIGLAGIMGGLESEITGDTRDILFECAAFERAQTRVTARSLGIRTEASGRFERGVNPATVMTALDRACHLVEALGAGEVVGGCYDYYPHPQQRPPVVGSVQRIAGRTGVAISGEEMVSLLERLQFEVSLAGDRLSATPPLFRQDIEQEADLCEEVLRLAGYDRIPSTRLRGEATSGGDSLRRRRQSGLQAVLSGLGYDEIINFSFFGQKQLDSLNLPPDDKRLNALRILNPLGEDTALMRTTLAPDMIRVLGLNMAHGNKEARLYEFGTLYDALTRTEEGLITERPCLSLGCYGPDLGFYPMRDAVLTLLAQQGIAYDIKAAESSYLHPGRCAVISAGSTNIALVGEVHPDIADAFGLTERACLAEIDLAALYAGSEPMGHVQDLPRMPSVGRDIALVLSETQPLLPVLQAIRRAGGALLEETQLFDVYRGAQLPEGKKSVAFSLSFRAADRTLEEKEIAALMDKIQRSCRMQFGAEVRG